MILWFRDLPQQSVDLSEWKPFIQNNWFSQHYMKFVYLFSGLIILLVFQACTGGIDQTMLKGKWKYVKVGVPNSSPPDTVTRSELEENNPSIEFKADNNYVINWGRKVLSHGTYALSGKNIKITETLTDGKKRAFQFYVSELSAKHITFETTEQGGSRVTAVKE